VPRNPASKLVPPFSYDPRSNRYRDSAGHFVSGATVRGALNDVLDAGRQRVSALSQELRDGTISLADWQRRMAQEVRTAQAVSAASAKGGWAAMTKSDWGKVGNSTKQQLKYLQQFALDIESGKQPLDGRLIARAELYPQAGRQTYSRVERQGRQEAGLAKERNVLGEADHCNGCLEATAEGWVEIGELVPIGDRDCMGRCKCHLEYK
jgi:hypothetical protein